MLKWRGFRRYAAVALAMTLLTAVTLNCAAQTPKLKGKFNIDGSSTVFPITEAMAVEFQQRHKDVKITVSEPSGTTNGFKAFISRSAVINDASRPINDKEKAECKEKGIEYLELQVAIDGLSVVVNPKNTWCDCLTIEDLKKIWEDGPAKKWSDIRPEWPKEEIKLYGPGQQSGTFDYFKEVVIGKSGKIRLDYSASENDNVLVKGVSGEKNALGYFGYAYVAPNTSKLKVVGISDGKSAECVKPNPQTIESGEYTPLSRPLFIYVNMSELKRPEVAEFVRFYLTEGQQYVSKVGSIPNNADTTKQALAAFEQALAKKTGKK